MYTQVTESPALNCNPMLYYYLFVDLDMFSDAYCYMRLQFVAFHLTALCCEVFCTLLLFNIVF